MLPFLKHKNEGSVAGLLIKNRASDEKPKESQEDMDHSAAIEACAQSLISAVHARDSKAVSEALADAFTILESMPHEESKEEHIEPHSYDAQNQKAAE